MQTKRHTWVRLAVVLTVTAGFLGACGSDDSDESSDTTVSTDACSPYTLEERELNDRCVTSPGVDVDWKAVPPDQSEGACGDDVRIVAVPDELLVAVDDPDQLAAEVEAVVALLGQEGIENPAPGGDGQTSEFAQIVTFDPTSTVRLLELLPLLQGVSRSVDLNYLEPLQPNNGFRPYDDPKPFEFEGGVELVGDESEGGEGKRVLVLDSTDDDSQFDIDGNRFVDEDHGHGQFVQSIIERRSGADVVLQAVENSAPRLVSGRWAPMMFSDLDVLRAMDEAFLGDASYDVVNMSLGGAGCADSSSLDWGVGERLALGRAMLARADYQLEASGTEMSFVAAAGNDGMDVMHFPAAWAGAAAMERLAIEIEKTSPDTADSVRELHRDLSGMVYAVGSTEESGDTSVYSNCGDWVNASAHGTGQVGAYPTSDLVTWSGTSFATANVSAMLVGGSSLDVVVPLAGLVCPPAPP